MAQNEEKNENILIIGDKLLSLVFKNTDVIPLVDKHRFKEVKARVAEITTVNPQQLESEVLLAASKISELHDELQVEVENLIKYKHLLCSAEKLHYRYFKCKLPDSVYAKYGKQNETLTAAEIKMAVEMQPDIRELSLSVDRLTRTVKYIEDQISLIKYSYVKGISASMDFNRFMEGSGS